MPASSAAIPRVLSIAGSDSGGGAGIQADLKAFAACGVHGMTAITALTAQNTVGVTAVHAVPPEIVVAQVAAVVADIGVDAVKIGMAGSVATVAAISEALDLLRPGTPIVLDPVMVSESGAVLLEEEARAALIGRLLPRVTVVTPNLPEARAIVATVRERRALAGAGTGTGTAGNSGVGDDRPPVAAGGDRPPATAGDDDLTAEALAAAVHDLGPGVVVLTGGHRVRASDLFWDGERAVELSGPRHPDGAAHGSGCTHSSVLAARLAWGDDPLTAARTARSVAARAVAQGLREIGAGAGPVDVLGIASA